MDQKKDEVISAIIKALKEFLLAEKLEHDLHLQMEAATQYKTGRKEFIAEYIKMYEKLIDEFEDNKKE